MKIVGKNSDYYDSALKFGFDETIIYVRKPEVKEFGHEDLGFSEGSFSIKKDSKGYYNRPHLSDGKKRNVVSGGRFVRPVIVSIAGVAHKVYIESEVYNGLVNHFRGNGIGSGNFNFEEFVRQDPRNTYGYHNWEDAFNEDEVELIGIEESYNKNPFRTRNNVSDNGENLKRDFTDVHLKSGAPVVMMIEIDRPSSYFGKCNRGSVIVVNNPCLKSLGFNKVINPHDMMQKISQFIGGVVPGNQMPMVEISDKAKVQKKGFDPVYGFRTRPTSVR